MTSSSRIWAGVALFVAIGAAIAFTWRADNESLLAPPETILEPIGQDNAADLTEVILDSDDAIVLEDSSFVSTLTTPVIATEGFVPHEMYLKYVDQAGAGDLVAVRILIEALRFCRNLGKDSYGEFEGYEDAIRRSTLAPEVQESLIQKSERCAPLVDLVGDTDQESTRLYEIISKARHPLIMVLQRNVTADEKRDRLLSVILADYPEFFLYERAFMEAGVYHRIYPKHVDPFREQAWFLLYCDASPSCDRNEFLDSLSSEVYHGHEVREIEEIEASIRAAMMAKDVEGLGF